MGAVGLSLIFGVTGLVNFAQGELVTFGGLAAWWLSTWGPGPGLPLVLAGILAVAAGAALGFSLELGLFRPLRRRRTGNVSLIVVTIGLSLVLSNIFLIMVGGHPLQYAQYVIQTQVGPGPFTVTPKDWIIIGLGIVILATVGLLLQRTRYGTALRAVSDNPDLASSSGIGVERVILITWMGGAALAATGGVFLGIATAVEWDMGLEMLLLLFAAVVLGGIGTVYGAVLGALVIGIVTQVSTYWVNPEAKNAVAFLVLIAVLLVRPRGFLDEGSESDDQRLAGCDCRRDRTPGRRLRAGRRRAEPPVRVHRPAQLRPGRVHHGGRLRHRHHRRSGRPAVVRRDRGRAGRGRPGLDLRPAHAAVEGRLPCDRHHHGGRDAAHHRERRQRELTDPWTVWDPAVCRQLLRHQSHPDRHVRPGPDLVLVV